MTRFCASCGTEVDDGAAFCPTCGQPIDQDAEVEMPPAPSWPEPETRVQPAFEPAAPDPFEAEAAEPPREERRWSAEPRPEPDAAEVTRAVEPPPPPAPQPAGAPRASIPPPASSAPARPAVDLPVTMPVTLSAWLIGGGAALGVLGALLAMFDGLGIAIDLLLLVGLLAVAASVFLPDRIPHVPQLRLITLSVVLVAFGVALDRLGFGRAGAGELLLFLGTAAAAIGVIILETGRDQPLGGPGS